MLIRYSYYIKLLYKLEGHLLPLASFLLINTSQLRYIVQIICSHRVIAIISINQRKTMKPKLYSFAVSSCSWRVRIALNFKEIDFEYKSVNLKNPEEKEELLKITPLGRVPALLIDGHLLSESMSILEFLEDRYTHRPLLPKSAFARAKVREICALIASGIQPLQHSTVVNKAKDNDPDEWKHYFNRRGLKALEKLLKDCSGKYCVGDDITLADCCLVPQVFAASVRFQVDLEEFPVISKIYSNLNSLDPFIKAHAINQPDPFVHYNEQLKLK